jgi:hypothetical protein
VKIGDACCQSPIDFLRIWSLSIKGAESSFHVPHDDALIKCRERGRGHGRSVPLNHYYIRLVPGQVFGEAGNRAGSELCHGLVGPHQVQNEIGSDVEYAKHVVEHLMVLCSRHDAGVDVISAAF